VNSDTLLLVVAIICITVLEVVNMLTMKIDGNILSTIVGAIVFIATRAYYKKQKQQK